MQSARWLLESMDSGEHTAVAVTEAALRRIDTEDTMLHSFVTVSSHQALAAADRIDQLRASGAVPGPLRGVPISIKDTYDTAGIRTTYGSRIHRDNVPEVSAPFVDRLTAAGGIIVGKTNTSEFAIYPRTVNDLMPETVNPWDRSRTCGGSSGGAAASVAAGLTSASVGGDGGGSIRIPAALCGVTGLKPSRGSVPRGGGPVSTRRFSVAGPIARSARDARILWEVMAGPSASDRLSREYHHDAPTEKIPSGSMMISLRWISNSGIDGDEPDVVSAIRDAVSRLANVDGIGVEDTALTMCSPKFSSAFYDIMMADRLSTGGADYLADPKTAELLTRYGREQFERASRVTGDQYSTAIELEYAARDHLDLLLADVDAVVTPTVGFVAPIIPTDGHTALPEVARRGLTAYTFLANYTGYPALTVPCGMVRGLPVGLQFVGRPYSEPLLLELADSVQENVYFPPICTMSQLVRTNAGGPQ